MRRAVLLPALLVAAAGATGCGHADETYRVDAIFDSAGFLTPDTDVRVAGAKAGKVLALSLTRDHKARITLSVDRRFAPFKADADCTIQPQSLISEKFVNCSPGSADARELRPPRGHDVPELPPGNTHAPVDLDLVLNIFRRPVHERLTLLLDALGGGLAARGDDLNATIRRSAPALQQTRRVLDIMRRENRSLARLVDDGDVVLAQLAAGRGRVARFVRGAGVVAAASGARQQRLEEAIARLPELLTRARPAFADLETFAQTGTPLARELRAASPGVQRLVEQLGPFAQQARPGVQRLGALARQTRPALPKIAPQVRRLRRFAAAARPTGGLLATLAGSLREQGVVEGVSNIFYYGAAATARFDSRSHILPAHMLSGPCALWASTPTPGCDAHYASYKAPAVRSRTRARRRAAVHRARPRRRAASAPAPSPTPAPTAAPAPTPAAPPLVTKPLPALPDAVRPPARDAEEKVTGLLDYLLG